eukprot:TRINITY_DN1280_c0_g1_i1.p1 TRINITY_DN1280_c0_g1~~TRINITY_DN1280_c0_g1_i1.p1  ORF type:complete len:763 (+),score=193.25 TRINITY_DN1280_c0_g1_i1:148-2436(+)
MSNNNNNNKKLSVPHRRLNNLLGQLSLNECSAGSNDRDVGQVKYADLPDVSDGPAILKKERSAASFDVHVMTNVLDGSETLTQLKELIISMMESDETLNDPNRFDLSRPEARISTMKKIKQTMELKRAGAGNAARAELESKSKEAAELDKDKLDTAPSEMEEAFYWAMSHIDAGWSTRMGVHFGLFANAIAGQATNELREKLWEDVQVMRIIGCFAMTELGHGSYIRGFETTATFDIKSQQFIINSPTLTSTKWWIGLAGQTATHTVAFARLLIPNTKGEVVDYGVHSFLVQIRDPATGKPLPGIRVGDCGAKMGRNGLDNGWIQFHSVRIPREHMLMRWAQVSPEGVYSNPPKAQLSYGSLINGRVSIVAGSSEAAKKALTIAIRYSAVRRQFPSPTFAAGAEATSSNSKEMQILDYQSHQNRLIPLLAGTYAFHFTSVQMKKHFTAVQKEIFTNDDFEISNLNTLHATSAGLKAFSTWWCNDAIEQCRQSCGGNGYSAYSGLSGLLADFAVMCTWEGDNTVLAQQTARFLLNAAAKSQKGEKLDGFTSYLAGGFASLNTPEMKSFPARTDADLLNPDLQLLAHRRLAIDHIQRCVHRLDAETARTGSKSEAWNECMVDLVESARAHCYYYVVYCFVEAVKELSKNQAFVKAGVPQILKKLCDLFALVNISNNLAGYLETGYINQAQATAIRHKVRVLCKEIRKEAIPLTDAFNFPDFLLNSALGGYDGDVYKKYFETVLNAPNSTVTPYWNDLVKPLVTE